ncbi:hypothetical protein E8E14_012662 [Neopestalotiopsis sp. 37M]|nr:hypothetical protein E8E14_012662 [Neopestalotiopsis sp. 37M]
MADSSTAASNDPHIFKMPVELLQLVTRHLTTPEYGYLRRTCKCLEGNLDVAFTREFFKKKQFMISSFSLQTLVDISNSRLADGLHHVIIGMDRPMETNRPGSFPGFDTHTASQKNNLLRHLEDHLALMYSGFDVKLLSEAFSKLPNLEIVEIRDFYSNRPRDGTRWKSYGVTTFQQETGIPMNHIPGYSYNTPSSGNDFPMRLFHRLLRALGEANIRLKRFEVNTRHDRSGLVDRAFEVQYYDEPKVSEVLAGLEAIHLDFSRNDYPIIVASVDGPDQPCHSFFLRKFFSLLQNLRTLRLNFHNMDTHTETQPLLHWLQSPLPLDTSTSPSPDDPCGVPQPPPPVLLEKLDHLEIGKVSIELDTLLGIFKKYKNTLRNVCLHRVGIVDPHALEAKTNQWAKLFRRMAQLDLNIDSITMSYLSQSRQGFPSSIPVDFRGAEASQLLKWHGKDLRGALMDFARDVQVHWPPIQDNESDDSMDDDDDGDDDDHDDDDDSDGNHD